MPHAYRLDISSSPSERSAPGLAALESMAEQLQRHDFRPSTSPGQWVAGRDWDASPGKRSPIGHSPSLLHNKELQEPTAPSPAGNSSKTPRRRRKGKKVGGTESKPVTTDAQLAARAAEVDALMLHAAKWVGAHGPKFEELLFQRHGHDPSWGFLQPSHEDFPRYRALVREEIEAAEAKKAGVVEAVQARVQASTGDSALASAASELAHKTASGACCNISRVPCACVAALRDGGQLKCADIHPGNTWSS